MVDLLAIGDEDVRVARHAYYGAISYVDDKVGELLAAVEASGQAENTIVIFTSDHGDMLGERGLWYKMHFFEWAARIPLLIHGPRWFAPRRISSDASLLDLSPSLIALADLEGAVTPALPDAPAGRSLLPDILGETPAGETEVLGEYLGESAVGPLVMIKRGRHKFILGEGCPALLYDLEQDPLERVNLAEQDAHEPLARALAEEVAQRWDFAALKEQVVADQDRRAFVDRAMKKGRHTAWDHQPIADATRLYARNVGETLGDAEHESRLPYLAPPEPDGPEAQAAPDPPA